MAKGKLTLEQKVSFLIKKSKYKFTSYQQEHLKSILDKYDHVDMRIIEKFLDSGVEFWFQRYRKLKNIKNNSQTLYRYILLYGKTLGITKFEEYKQKQAESNTFEYKNKKLGWSKEEFNRYNKSRAITLENMIQKYGVVLGSEKFENYRIKQKTHGSSLEWFKKKYGDERGVYFWEILCENKAQTIQNFIKRYGDNEGRKKYFDYINQRKNYFSQISQELFLELDDDDAYFATKNSEFFLYSHELECVFFYDYVLKSKKKCIEFNGDYWHMNPSIYNEDDVGYFGYNASEIWEKDRIKNNALEKEGFEILVIWENEYKENKNLIVEKCKNFLGLN